jgi:hypothetical protein
MMDKVQKPSTIDPHYMVEFNVPRVWQVWFMEEAKDFSSNLCVQTGSKAHPASCTMGTGGPFAGAKARPRSDADHSPPCSVENK